MSPFTFSAYIARFYWFITGSVTMQDEQRKLYEAYENGYEKGRNESGGLFTLLFGIAIGTTIPTLIILGIYIL